MNAYRGAETVLIPAKGGDRMHDPADFGMSPGPKAGEFFRSGKEVFGKGLTKRDGTRKDVPVWR
jgi:hypothetical protein